MWYKKLRKMEIARVTSSSYSNSNTEVKSRPNDNDDGGAGAVACKRCMNQIDLEKNSQEVADNEFQYALPPEVWENVLSFVKDPQSLLNCSNTCSSFYDLLHNKITTFLFPLIVPILEKRLPKNEILKLRGVSKKWKDSTDFVLQNTNTWDPLFEDIDIFTTQRISGISRLGTSFRSPEDIEQFMSDMENFHGNPFPNRTVVFLAYAQELDDLPAQNLYYQRFHELTLKFGEHIWNCVYVAIDDVIASISGIQYIFQYLTNLRSLTLYMSHTWKDDDSIVQLGLDWMNEYPLPDLPSLTCLRVHGEQSHVITDPLFEKYGDQLEILECEATAINKGSYFCHSSRDQRRAVLRNLREAKISNRYGRRHYTLMHRLSYSQLALPLRRLSLDFWGRWKEEIPLTSLVRFINQFSETLVELFVPMPLEQLQIKPTFYNVKDLGTWEKEMRVVFPNLKVLGLEYSFLLSPVTIKLLKKFVSLEKLQFHNNYESYRKLLHLINDVDSSDDERCVHSNVITKPVLFTHNLKQMKKFVDEFLCAAPTLENISAWKLSNCIYRWSKSQQEFEGRTAMFDFSSTGYHVSYNHYCGVEFPYVGPPDNSEEDDIRFHVSSFI